MERKSTTPISFIIRHKDEYFNLTKTIESMGADQALSAKDQIIVSDDGSAEPPMGWPTLINTLSEFAFPARVHLVRKPKGLKLSGSAAAGQRGSEVARNEFLCFLDSHMAFGKGWREFDIGNITAAHQSIFSPLWNPVARQQWDFEIRDRESDLGARWWWNENIDGILSVFNFSKIGSSPSLSTPGFFPMSGCYFVSKHLFDYVGGFKGTPFNHGTEAVLAFKIGMSMGKKTPYCDSGVVCKWMKIGHVGTGRKQTNQATVEGIANGVALIAILDTWETAIHWLNNIPPSPIMVDVAKLVAELRPEIKLAAIEYFEVRRWSLNDACEALKIRPPSEIRDAISSLFGEPETFNLEKMKIQLEKEESNEAE